jgi:hypothetical protein
MGKIIMPPKLHLLALLGLSCKTSRCNFGGQNKSARNIFRCMKLEELMAVKYSKIAGRCTELAETSFTIRKMEFQSKLKQEKGLESE